MRIFRKSAETIPAETRKATTASVNVHFKKHIEKIFKKNSNAFCACLHTNQTHGTWSDRPASKLTGSQIKSLSQLSAFSVLGQLGLCNKAFPSLKELTENRLREEKTQSDTSQLTVLPFITYSRWVMG